MCESSVDACVVDRCCGELKLIWDGGGVGWQDVVMAVLRVLGLVMCVGRRRWCGSAWVGGCRGGHICHVRGVVSDDSCGK